MEKIEMPSKKAIVAVLRKHPLIRLKERVLRAYLVGSFSKGTANKHSDVDILLEVEQRAPVDAKILEDQYRQALRQYFVTHNIKGKNDSVHPNWDGRRVDLYFTYDADAETRPKILLSP